MIASERIELATIRLSLESEPAVNCSRWQISDPASSNEAAASSVVKLEYGGSPLNATGRVVRLAILLDGTLLDERHFTVEAEARSGPGACSLTLIGTADELWRLVLLLRMAGSEGGLSALFLKDDVQRWAWIRAALYFSGVITPWIQLSNFGREFARTRPIPDAISVTLEPALFRSRSTFFSLFAERLLGPAGYAGQDLQGFAEVVRVVTHLVRELTVNVVDTAGCELAVVENFDAQDQGFFRHVHEILSESATVRTTS